MRAGSSSPRWWSQRKSCRARYGGCSQAWRIGSSSSGYSPVSAATAELCHVALREARSDQSRIAAQELVAALGAFAFDDDFVQTERTVARADHRNTVINADQTGCQI